jgi:hypothetical protein
LSPLVTIGSLLNLATRFSSDANVTTIVNVVEPEPVLPATSVAVALSAWSPRAKV